MVSITELWLALLLSAVFVFIASSIIHMALPIHKGDFKKMPGEDKVLAEIRAQGLSRGTYMFPCPGSMKAMGSPEMIEKFQRGPVGFMTIVPSGGDVHTFEPTPADVRTLLGANLVLVNGRGLDDGVARAARQGLASVWTLSAGIEPVAEPEGVVIGGAADAHADEDTTGGNPHLWMDPLRAIQYVEQTRAALTAVDPAGAEVYTELITRELQVLGQSASVRQAVTDVAKATPTATPAAAASTPAPTATVVPSRQPTLSLTAQESAQLTVTVDGAVAFSGRLGPSQSQSWVADRTIEIPRADGGS